MKLMCTLLLVMLTLIASPAHGADHEPRVLVIGDSIAWGYADQIDSRLDVVNASIPGSCLFVRQCSNRDAPRFMDRLRDAHIRHGDTVVVSIGHNDLQPGRARDYVDAYLKAVRYIERQGASAYVATITPFGGELLWGRDVMDERRVKVNRWIVTHVPSIKLTQPLGGTHMRSSLDSGDGLHPNAEGSALLARAVSVALRH